MRLHALFFASGAAALGLQLVWMKQFAAGLGHDMPALLAVVTAFFGGMALGAWRCDRATRVSPDPRRRFARLQFVIGAWAALVTLFVPVLNRVAIELVGAGTAPGRQAVVSFLVPFLALLPATGAMGATLPAMECWLAPLAGQRALGLVYASNTGGAVVGTLATAFLLVPNCGFVVAGLVLAGVNIVVGAQAWNSAPLAVHGAARHPGGAAEAVGPPPNAQPPMSRGRLLAMAFLAGLCGIGYEILGVRVLSQVLDNTFFTYAVALAVFLLGTSVGAAAYGRLGREFLGHRARLAPRNRGRPVSRPSGTLSPAPSGGEGRGEGAVHPTAGVGYSAGSFRAVLALLLSALAVVCLAESWVMARVPAFHDAVRAHLGKGLGAVFLGEFLVALAVFLPPTLLMGATFSHLVGAARTRDSGIGSASAMNTLGGASASVVFGVLLLPALGAKGALVALVAGYLLALPTIRGAGGIGVVACAGLVFFLPPDLRLVRLPPGAIVRDYRDGVMATVAVLESPDGHRSLRVNNRFQMGGTAAALAERRQAHLPLLLHPRPRRALFLGPGTGITLGGATEHPGLEIDGVELVPEVIQLMSHFAPENRGVGGPKAPQPETRVRLIAADARRFVRASPEHYDVIVADLFHPAQDGAGFLYTREHFDAVRQRLASGGLFCQWLPLHQLDEPTLRSITRTFLEVFPHTHAFLLHFNTDIPALGLVGTPDARMWTPDWLERRGGDLAFQQALKQAGFDRTLALLGCHLAGPSALAAFAEGGALNTDDFPRVSFAAPHFAAHPEIRRDALLLALLDRFAPEPSGFLAPETAGFAARLADFVAARNLYLHGLSVEADQNLPGAIDRYLDATRRSLYFTPAYARLVNIIQVMASADRASARQLFGRLQEAQPAQPLGQQLLGPLFRE